MKPLLLVLDAHRLLIQSGALVKTRLQAGTRKCHFRKLPCSVLKFMQDAQASAERESYLLTLHVYTESLQLGTSLLLV